MNVRGASGRALRDEQGAVIIHTAMAMLVLLGLSTFVADYGILWLSRQQAQNAADAAAVAGAVSRAYDDSSDPPSAGGVVELSAQQTGTANPVWFEAASVGVSYGCPGGVAVPCVRVDVHRDGTFGSTPLPVLFAPALGIVSQGVRATATAQVAVGNGTTCLKPWAIPDKWVELNPVAKPWAPGDVFERYSESGAGSGTLLMPSDFYDPPDAVGPGTGFARDSELGLDMLLTFGDPEVVTPISTSFLLPLILSGTSTYEESITGCNGRLSSVGQFVPTGSSSMQAPTLSGFTGLINADPGASWNGATNNVQGSCAPVCAAISPRLVAIALFDVDLYQYMRSNNDWTTCPGSVPCVKISNIVGFFLDHLEAGGVRGFLARYPGLFSPDTFSLPSASSFLPAITLVR